VRESRGQVLWALGSAGLDVFGLGGSPKLASGGASGCTRLAWQWSVFVSAKAACPKAPGPPGGGQAASYAGRVVGRDDEPSR